MDYFKLIQARYSVRRFDKKPVENAKLNTILLAGRIAPTASNRQPQQIFVLRSDQAREKMKSCTRCHFNPPVALLVCHDKNRSSVRAIDNHDMGYGDAVIVTTHMMLAAAAQGLGSCWIGDFDPRMVTEVFSLSDNLVPNCFLYIGYPAADCTVNPRHTQRLDLSETVAFLD